VLQELGGWKSVSMVRRYAHMSVKHLQPYADRLTLRSHRRVTETRQIRLARKVTKVVTMGAVHGSGWWPDQM